MFYVYILIRPDGRPFYVGKGKGKRVHQHEAEARTDCQCHKCRTIRKIWKAGGSVTKSIVFETTKEEEAYQREAALIEQLGLDSLTNAIPGERRWVGERERIEVPANEQGWINLWRRNGLSEQEIRKLLHQRVQQELIQLVSLRERANRPIVSQERRQQLDEQIEAYTRLWRQLGNADTDETQQPFDL